MKEPDTNDHPAEETPDGISRRDFVTTAVAATSAAAVLGPALFAQKKKAAACATETLTKIGEIVSDKGTLKGVLKIKNGPKALPGYTGSQLPMMRYFEGYDQQRANSEWPTNKQGCWPGPTLRVKVGERVNLTLLNQVDVGAFGGSLDKAETGQSDGCDEATNATLNPPDKDWYPVTRGDTFPNCFHGSSTSNLHFHGTHITPDGFGDNVLVQVRPDPNITEKDVEPIFRKIFELCEKYGGAPSWNSLPPEFKEWQDLTVREYDLHAIWKGTRGPIKDESGKELSALPLGSQLSPVNEDAIERGIWPPYFIGAYPSCFQLTEATGHEMGQSPGTHWYHSHKHGSTAINLYNGLAGALIIEGKYDEELVKIYPNLKKTEKVLVVQVFEDLPNLERAAGGTKATMTNGSQVVTATGKAQVAPTIVMRPGEIQLWRIVNAQARNVINGAKFTGVAGAAASPLPQFRQIAQDGVQFDLTNYQTQPLTQPDPNTKNGTQFTLAEGQRIDVLVQAPKVTGTQSYELAGVVNLTVCGDAASDEFPTADNYPTFPDYLDDIGECDLTRTLTFDWEPYRTATGPASATKPTHAKPLPFNVEVGNAKVGFKTINIATNRAPYFMIDDEQFSDEKYYQTMILGDHEEWKIYNYTSLAHPFHIHVNPFQVVELSDPNTPANSFVREKSGVWQDVVNIPAAKNTKGQLTLDSNGKAATPGYVRIRSRFVDFPGSFVLHCHILAHEDRGMMQLIRVISGATTIKHH